MQLLARVRGIYATAITKILRDKGIEITQPTEPIMERFEIATPLFLPPSVTIKDRDDKKGIVIIGEPMATDTVVSIFESELHHIIVKKFRPSLYSIYKGRVVEFRDGMAIVDIGEAIGKLPLEHSVKVEPGEEIVVCVLRPSLRGEPLLSLNLVVSGKYMRLVKGARLTFSKFISMDKRSKLVQISSLLKLEGWGIKWRSSANYADMKSILSDYENIRKTLKELKKLADKCSAPSLLREGEKIVEIIFPLEVKERLDQIRSQVLPTAPHHHHMKSIAERRLQGIIEFVEYIVERNPDILRSIKSLYIPFFLKKMFKKRKKIELIQEDVDKGKIIILGTIENLDYDNYTFVIRRNIRGRGVYDGLNIKKEIGDYALTYVQIGKPYIVHSYYNRNGVLKGVYININTPVEIYSERGLWCMDLKVDLVSTLKGNSRIIDTDELHELEKRGIISNSLLSKIMTLTESLRNIINNTRGLDKLIEELFTQNV